MASPLPPDPYLALGLPRDATAATIKTTYRKLILKFHPDKVQDAAQKQIASDQFHKVQTAYEIIGEEDRRARYDAQCKLVELRKDMLKQGSGANAQSEVRGSSYSRMRPESPARPNYTARASERNERVHVEERRPYDAEPDYFGRPRSTARKDYEYERPSPKRAPVPAPRTEKERARVSRQSTKENERARQKEKMRQTTRDTRRDRDAKYSSYPDPDTSASSDSDGVVEPPRSARREEDDRRRERDAYYEQARRKEESPRAFHMEDRSHHKMQTHEMSARDYIERSGGRSRQYQESARRASPPPRVSTKDKVEYIKRSEGRPAVMVRRGSGKPRPASREPEELPRRESPRRESPRRDRERTRRMSHDYSDLPRKAAPPLNSTKSAPEHIHIPEAPRRAYSMQTEAKPESDFQPPQIRRADTMPVPRREREPTSSRKPQKSSGLRRTETTDSLPTPAATPEPQASHNVKYPYGREYADDHEFATPGGYRTEVHAPAAAGSRKVTRSPSPMKEERIKEDRGRASSSRYPPTSQRPPLPASRTTSYVYTPQGLQDMPAGRPGLSRSESVRTEVPSQLYGEIPTSRSPRTNRARHSPPSAEAHYQQYRPEDVKYQTGYSSRRASETMRPGYARGNSYTSQAAY